MCVTCEFEDLVAPYRRGAMDQIPGHEPGKHNPHTLGVIDDAPRPITQARTTAQACGLRHGAVASLPP
jgi:hypothetical protein